MSSLNELIPIVNELQDLFSELKTSSTIQLPQIVVIGGQSSGKSSVLEGIVGKEFLPRGTGIVTRCPLIVQMTHTSALSDEYGEFLHNSGKKYYEFTEIRDEISRQTDIITSSKKGITDKVIRLRIYSPDVLNLTVVDLPGITKVPIEDQPTNIEKLIKDMCLTYISNPHSIILAVSSATNDITNSDALKLARDVDPDGKRTVGVITKLDLMDKGTNATNVLNGNIVKLKHDFIGVVNRSQADLDSNKTIVKTREDENDFFISNYRSVAYKHGIKYLSKKLYALLMESIRLNLPEVKHQVVSQLNEVKYELKQLGDPMEYVERTKELLMTIGHFADHFIKDLQGSHFRGIDKKLNNGAKIREIFSNTLCKDLENMNPFENITDETIRIAIHNSTGIKSLLFFPESVFTQFIEVIINRFEPICVRTAESVYALIDQSISESKKIRYEGLADKLKEITRKLLQEYMKPTIDSIMCQIEMEKAYINTNHPNFIKLDLNADKEQEGEHNTPLLLHNKTNRPELLDFIYSEMKITQKHQYEYNKEKSQIKMLKQCIVSYFNIVKQNLEDRIPKVIMYEMIYKIQKNLHSTLLNELYGKPEIENLLRDSEEVIENRKYLQEMKNVLEKGVGTIERIIVS